MTAMATGLLREGAAMAKQIVRTRVARERVGLKFG
jgi:hypothetical protein